MQSVSQSFQSCWVLESCIWVRNILHPGRWTAGTYSHHPSLERKIIFHPNLHEDMFQPLIFQGVPQKPRSNGSNAPQNGPAGACCSCSGAVALGTRPRGAPGGSGAFGVSSWMIKDVGGEFFEKKKRNCPNCFVVQKTVFSIRDKEKKSLNIKKSFSRIFPLKSMKKTANKPYWLEIFDGFLPTFHEIYLFPTNSSTDQIPRSDGPKGQIWQVGIDVQTDQEQIKGHPTASLKCGPPAFSPPPKTKWFFGGPFFFGVGATETVYVGDDPDAVLQPKMIACNSICPNFLNRGLQKSSWKQNSCQIGHWNIWGFENERKDFRQIPTKMPSHFQQRLGVYVRACDNF